MLLVNMRDGGFISAYDFEIGQRIARVMCGGEVESGSVVDEDGCSISSAASSWRCCATRSTQARIAHTLATGKPLRN